MNEQPSSEQEVDLSTEIVEDRRVMRFIRAAKNASHGFAYMAFEDRLRMMSMLRELLRHRKLEHDAFWGEDDE